MNVIIQNGSPTTLILIVHFTVKCLQWAGDTLSFSYVNDEYISFYFTFWHCFLLQFFLFILCSWCEVNFSVYDRFHHLYCSVSLGIECITIAHITLVWTERSQVPNLDPDPMFICFSKWTLYSWKINVLK